MERVQLEVITLKEGVSHSNSYNVLLKEKNGNRSFVMVIGYSDAQSIAISLEGHYSARPLTHDLFLKVCQTFNISIIEVAITTLKEGIYYANIVCKKGELIIDFDSRSSDAIALALRFNCPIFINNDLLNKISMDGGITSKQTIKEFEQELAEELKELETFTIEEIEKLAGFSTYTLEELNSMLEEALIEENYEKAAKIRDEISKR